MMGDFSKIRFKPRISVEYLSSLTGVDGLEPSRRAKDGSNEISDDDISEKSFFASNCVYIWTNSIESIRFGIGSTRRRWINR